MMLFRITIALVFLLCSVSFLNGQDPLKTSSADSADMLPITDQPRTIPPDAFLPSSLAVKVSCEFENEPLESIINWLKPLVELPVVIDMTALKAEGLTLESPVSLKLEDEPLYFLLNRLSAISLGWSVEESILQITSTIALEDRRLVEMYSISDLLDAEYSLIEVASLVEMQTSGFWLNADGEGGALRCTGSLLVVSCDPPRQMEVRGLLQSLRKHGQQTFVLEPAEHIELRDKLDLPFDAPFFETPFEDVVVFLEDALGVPVNISQSAKDSKSAGLSDPVTLTLEGHRLRDVLTLLLQQKNLTWTIKDNSLWIISHKESISHLKSAVYDVQDLCQTVLDRDALRSLLLDSLDLTWFELDGEGGVINVPGTGTLVVRQTDPGHDQVLQFLNELRFLQAQNSDRFQLGPDPDEIVTRYYRLDNGVADTLKEYLPQYLEPETWTGNAKTPEKPFLKILPAISRGSTAAFSLQPALMVRHSRLTQHKIEKILDDIKRGVTLEQIYEKFP